MTVTPEIIAAQVQDRTRRLIKTTGEVVPYPLALTNDQIREAIGAPGALDTVNLWHLGRSPLFVMSIIDKSYETESVDHGGGHLELKPTKALYPVNPIATAIYHANCVPGTTHEILGDVFICSDDDFADPEDL